MVDPGYRSKFASLLKLDRTTLYRTSSTLNERDAEDIALLWQLHEAEPRYGVRRIALALGWNIKKARRIRNLAKITTQKPANRPSTSRKKPEIPAPPNLLQAYWKVTRLVAGKVRYDFSKLTNPALGIWAQDFTYIYWHGRFLYLAVTLRLADRQPVGWRLGEYHTADLICKTLVDGLLRYNPPIVVHNDRGSEYMSTAHQDICKAHQIKMSASEPGNPWQNPYIESFFNTFKSEMLKKVREVNTLVEVYELIANWMYYYSHQRIHTELKMPPVSYARQLGFEEPAVLHLVPSKKDIVVA